MDTLHDQAFHTDRWPMDVLEGHLHGPLFDVQIHSTRWQGRGEAVFEPSMCFIEMFLSTARQVSGTYLRDAPPNDYALLGNISLIPERAPLYCRWTPGAQRSVSCMFDVARLFERAAVDEAEWRWPSFDLEKALNIQNEYVRVGLRRIAEELLSPGFASAMQIECSLLFVALELQRHFAGGDPPGRSGPGKLSGRHLGILRSMIIDTPGGPPTIGELAAACGMGGRQLALSYRRTTGATLRTFVAETRLERAKRQLLDGRTLIKQIAFDSGFQSSAAFTAAFRKATGKTPVEFRSAKAVSWHN